MKASLILQFARSILAWPVERRKYVTPCPIPIPTPRGTAMVPQGMRFDGYSIAPDLRDAKGQLALVPAAKHDYGYYVCGRLAPGIVVSRQWLDAELRRDIAAIGYDVADDLYWAFVRAFGWKPWLENRIQIARGRNLLDEHMIPHPWAWTYHDSWELNKLVRG